MIRRPPRSTHCISSAASDVYKRQAFDHPDSYYQKEYLPRLERRAARAYWEQAHGARRPLVNKGDGRGGSFDPTGGGLDDCPPEVVAMAQAGGPEPGRGSDRPSNPQGSSLPALKEIGLSKTEGMAMVRGLPKVDGKGICLDYNCHCLLYTSPSPRDQRGSRMPSSA